MNIYKFLRCEESERLDTKKVMERQKIQMEQRTRKPIGERLHDKNLVKAINCRVIPVAGYMMNIYNFTGKELHQLDKRIKKVKQYAW